MKFFRTSCILAATKTLDLFERLAFLQYSSEALQRAGLKVEDLGLEISDIIKLVNKSYHGSAPEASAIHKIASGILSSFPRKSE